MNTDTCKGYLPSVRKETTHFCFMLSDWAPCGWALHLRDPTCLTLNTHGGRFPSDVDALLLKSQLLLLCMRFSWHLTHASFFFFFFCAFYARMTCHLIPHRAQCPRWTFYLLSLSAWRGRDATFVFIFVYGTHTRAPYSLRLVWPCTCPCMSRC